MLIARYAISGEPIITVDAVEIISRVRADHVDVLTSWMGYR